MEPYSYENEIVALKKKANKPSQDHLNQTQRFEPRKIKEIIRKWKKTKSKLKFLTRTAMYHIQGD